MHKIWCNGQSYSLMYFIEILLKQFGGCWNWLACVKLQIIHCSSFMHCISIYECRFWSPSHVPLSPPAPLCLPWIWKQACRPFPLSHYHIQRGEIGGVGGQRKLRIGSKGKATPSLCHPAFLLDFPSTSHCLMVGGCSLFLSLPALNLKGANWRRVRGEWSSFYALRKRNKDSEWQKSYGKWDIPGRQ